MPLPFKSAILKGLLVKKTVVAGAAALATVSTVGTVAVVSADRLAVSSPEQQPQSAVVSMENPSGPKAASSNAALVEGPAAVSEAADAESAALPAQAAEDGKPEPAALLEGNETALPGAEPGAPRTEPAPVEEAGSDFAADVQPFSASQTPAAQTAAAANDAAPAPAASAPAASAASTPAAFAPTAPAASTPAASAPEAPAASTPAAFAPTAPAASTPAASAPAASAPAPAPAAPAPAPSEPVFPSGAHTTSIYEDESTLLRREYYDENNHLYEYSRVEDYDHATNSYTENVYRYDEEANEEVLVRTDVYENGECVSTN